MATRRLPRTRAARRRLEGGRRWGSGLGARKPGRRTRVDERALSKILLGLLDRTEARSGLSRILLVFGRVPLFYYVLHIYLLNVLARLSAVVFHQPIFHGTVIADFAQRPAGCGHGLLFIYGMWILTIVILYLPCRWFMEFRSRHRDWAWLSYL